METNKHIRHAISQGDNNGDTVTHHGETALFTTEMVHNNPGLEPYTSAYTNPEFLASRGYDGKVFFLYEAAQYGLLWDKFDEAQGIILTKQQFNENPIANKDTNNKKVFPFGTMARTWAEGEKARLTAGYSEAITAGEKVYFMMDIISLPVHLQELYPEIVTNGKIDILHAKTEEIMEYMYAEMFVKFPQIDGIYIRYGENYVGPEFNTPYHKGNNPIIGDSLQYHMHLINFLRDRLCEGNYLTSKSGAFYKKGKSMNLTGKEGSIVKNLKLES